MSRNVYRLLVGLATLGCAIVIILVVRALPAGVIGGAVGGLVTALILKKYVKEEVAQAMAKAVSQPVLSERDPEKILRELLSLNVKVRTEELPQELIPAVESVIDLMVEVVPEMTELYPGEELTWETLRMADKHLPGLIGHFSNLSPGDRAEKQGKLLESLAAMKNELEDIRKLVRDHQSGEFDRKAAVIKMKYGTEPLT